MFAASFSPGIQGGGSLEYFELLPDGQRLRPAFCPQFGINIADMTLHGGYGDDQLPGDFLVGLTGFNELQHFHLAHGQRLDQELHGWLCHTGSFTNHGQQYGCITDNNLP